MRADRKMAPPPPWRSRSTGIKTPPRRHTCRARTASAYAVDVPDTLARLAKREPEMRKSVAPPVVIVTATGAGTLLPRPIRQPTRHRALGIPSVACVRARVEITRELPIAPWRRRVLNRRLPREGMATRALLSQCDGGACRRPRTVAATTAVRATAAPTPTRPCGAPL